MKRCDIEGCNNKYRNRGRCWTHRLPALLPVIGCSELGCLRKHEAHGLCRLHYRAHQRINGRGTNKAKEYLKKWGRTNGGRYSQLKRAARDKSLGFDISFDQHAKLLRSPCHYCGGPLNETGHALDRVDNRKGYCIENVVPCCVTCNRIKGPSLTYDEMVVAMTAVLAFRRSKKYYGS